MIDSEEYREGTYEKLDNRAPLGVVPGSWWQGEAMTKYLWYNGSTSFVGGEEFEREREDEVKAKREERGEAFP